MRCYRSTIILTESWLVKREREQHKAVRHSLRGSQPERNETLVPLSLSSFLRSCVYPKERVSEWVGFQIFNHTKSESEEMGGGGGDHGHGNGDFRTKVWSMTGGPYCRPKHWKRNTAIAMFGVVLVCIPIAMKSAELEVPLSLSLTQTHTRTPIRFLYSI